MRTTEPDIVELELDFQGLTISIRGSASTAASFVRNLESPAPSSAPGSSARVGFSVSPVRHTPSVVESGSPISVSARGSFHQRSFSSVESRSQILASFPSIPQDWLRVAATRLSGSRHSGEFRAQRAWTCGNWARAVLAGRISTPNRSPSLDIASQFYCVLHCAGISTPRVFTSSRLFFQAVGRLEGSSTLCQGFPSEEEARIYFEGAGLPFPRSFN